MIPRTSPIPSLRVDALTASSPVPNHQRRHWRFMRTVTVLPIALAWNEISSLAAV